LAAERYENSHQYGQYKYCGKLIEHDSHGNLYGVF